VEHFCYHLDELFLAVNLVFLILKVVCSLFSLIGPMTSSE
jgi:hypothetical protein